MEKVSFYNFEKAKKDEKYLQLESKKIKETLDSIFNMFDKNNLSEDLKTKHI